MAPQKFRSTAQSTSLEIPGMFLRRNDVIFPLTKGKQKSYFYPSSFSRGVSKGGGAKGARAPGAKFGGADLRKN